MEFCVSDTETVFRIWLLVSVIPCKQNCSQVFNKGQQAEFCV